jgi:PQQ-like domain
MTPIPTTVIPEIGGLLTRSAGEGLLRCRAKWGVPGGRIYSGLNTGGSDAQYGLAVSPSGDRVYVTGESAGAGEYNIDYATVAYDARSGRQLWVSRQDRGGADRAGAIAVDAGHVFVTGDSYTGPNGGDYDAYTVTLSPGDGHVLWQATLGGPGYDDGRALVAGGGRVIVATQSPGATQADGLDAITAAYDVTTGRELWRTRLAETGRGELANGLALAPGGGVAYLVASTHPTIPYTALDE